MEEKIAALEKSIVDIIHENSKLKQEVTSLKKKVSEIEKTNQNYLSRIENLEKRDKYTQIQSKLTNAPKLEVRRDHKEWITLFLLLKGDA